MNCEKNSSCGFVLHSQLWWSHMTLNSKNHTKNDIDSKNRQERVKERRLPGNYYWMTGNNTEVALLNQQGSFTVIPQRKGNAT